MAQDSTLSEQEIATLRDGYTRMRGFVDAGRWQASPWAEGTFTSLMLSRLAEASHFIDIGAAVGFYSALALRHLPAHGRVVAFEPDPESAAVLREGLGSDPRFRLVQAAVSCETGTITLGRPVSKDYPCATMAGLESSRTFTVQTVVLNDVLADLTGRCVIKMDIEGAEALALEGLGDAMSHLQPELFFEIHPELIAKIRPGGLRAMEEQAASARYRLYNCDYEAPMPTPSLVGSRLYAAPESVDIDTQAASTALLVQRAKRRVRELLKGY